MGKTLFLGSLSLDKNRLDGVTIKSRTLIEWLENKNVDLKIIDTDNWTKNFLTIIMKTIKLFKNSDKIIICSADRGAYFALKILNLFNVKKTIYYFVAGGRLADRINNFEYNKKTYEICKKIYVESKDMKDKLVELGLNNSTVMHNFRVFNCENEIRKVGNRIKCVYFGRIIPEKGIGDAINVVEKVIDKGYDISFHMYGQINDEYYKEIKSNLNDNIKYCGFIDNSKKPIEDILKNYDILLFPTKYEGECLPGTLIESYISGLAIIGSNWRYAQEYIPNNKVGKIFDFNDCNDFEIKLLDLINNKEKINEYKKNSREESFKYHCDSVLQDFLSDLRLK